MRDMHKRICLAACLGFGAWLHAIDEVSPGVSAPRARGSRRVDTSTTLADAARPERKVTPKPADTIPPEPPVVRQATGLIGGVTIQAVSDEFAGAGWDLLAVHLVDGSGVSGEPPGHAQIAFPGGDSWQTGAGTGAASISFDLQTPCELRRVHVWNLNFYPPYHGRGAREVVILTSADANDWTSQGMVVFSMATGAAGDPGFDLDATGWGAARYVRFDILNNYGGWDNAGCVGLSEVRFFDNLPSSSPTRPTWTWTPGGGGDGLYRVKLDDPDLTNDASLVAALSWTPAAELSAGVHTLYVQERDDAGNWSLSGSAAVVVPDLVPPGITGLDNDEEPRQGKTWTWGATEAPVTFRHALDADPNALPGGGYEAVATATQTGGDGLYYLHVQARDEAGNESPVVTVHALLDNTAPVVSGLADDPGPRRSKTWTWAGADADPVLRYRYVIDQAPSGAPSGAYGAETGAVMEGATGVWYLHVQAHDRAGNESLVATVSVLLDSNLPHQADGDGDWAIELTPELTRLIQFYNLGGYHCQAGTEDGYAPGAGATTDAAHQADQNGDWSIQLSPELTRLIQFYNSGGYHCETGTEDGYAPGPTTGKGAAKAGALTAVRQVGLAEESADGTLEVTVTLTPSAPATLTSLAVQETLPAGWTFLGVVSHPAPEIGPALGTTGPLAFAWVKLPTLWPLKLTYRVRATPGAGGAQEWGGKACFRAGGGEVVAVTAAQPSGGAATPGLGWFNLSGPYTSTVLGNPLSLALVHDSQGRLTGTATLQVNTGTEMIPVTLAAKGQIRGSNGDSLLARLALQGSNEAGGVKVTLALDLALDPAARRLVGRAIGRLSVGPQTTPVSQSVGLDLPAPMDGTWVLRFNLAQSGTTVSGSATLTLSNGVAHLLAVTGNAAGESAALTLWRDASATSEHGIRMRATISPVGSEYPCLQSFSGRGYGQVLGW